MRISDWSSDVCSSDLPPDDVQVGGLGPIADRALRAGGNHRGLLEQRVVLALQLAKLALGLFQGGFQGEPFDQHGLPGFQGRSEEHTSELRSLMRISYAVFCLKKKNTKIKTHSNNNTLYVQRTAEADTF